MKQPDFALKHQLRIARRTLFDLSEAGALILGGMTKNDARDVLMRYGTPRDRKRAKLHKEK